MMAKKAKRAERLNEFIIPYKSETLPRIIGARAFDMEAVKAPIAKAFSFES